MSVADDVQQEGRRRRVRWEGAPRFLGGGQIERAFGKQPHSHLAALTTTLYLSTHTHVIGFWMTTAAVRLAHGRQFASLPPALEHDASSSSLSLLWHCPLPQTWLCPHYLCLAKPCSWRWGRRRWEESGREGRRGRRKRMPLPLLFRSSSASCPSSCSSSFLATLSGRRYLCVLVALVVRTRCTLLQIALPLLLLFRVAGGQDEGRREGRRVHICTTTPDLTFLPFPNPGLYKVRPAMTPTSSNKGSSPLPFSVAEEAWPFCLNSQLLGSFLDKASDFCNLATSDRNFVPFRTQIRRVKHEQAKKHSTLT